MLIAGIAIAELALANIQQLSRTNLSRKIPVHERRSQSYNTRLSHFAGKPRWHHSRRLSRLCPVPIAANPNHNEQIANEKRAIVFGNVLIIFQFALSIFLIIVTLMMGKQLTFLRTKPLGYQTENIVTISTYPLEEESKTLPTVFRDALAVSPCSN